MIPSRSSRSVRRRAVLADDESERGAELETELSDKRQMERIRSPVVDTRRIYVEALEVSSPCEIQYVKAYVRYFRCRPRPVFKVTACDLRKSASASLRSEEHTSELQSR